MTIVEEKQQRSFRKKRSKDQTVISNRSRLNNEIKNKLRAKMSLRIQSLKEHEKKLDYSSGDSTKMFTESFNLLTKVEKHTRIMYLWQKAYRKSRGAAIILKKYHIFQT